MAKLLMDVFPNIGLDLSKFENKPRMYISSLSPTLSPAPVLLLLPSSPLFSLSMLISHQMAIGQSHLIDASFSRK